MTISLTTFYLSYCVPNLNPVIICKFVLLLLWLHDHLISFHESLLIHSIQKILSAVLSMQQVYSYKKIWKCFICSIARSTWIPKDAMHLVTTNSFSDSWDLPHKTVVYSSEHLSREDCPQYLIPDLPSSSLLLLTSSTHHSFLSRIYLIFCQGRGKKQMLQHHQARCQQALWKCCHSYSLKVICWSSARWGCSM